MRAMTLSEWKRHFEGRLESQETVRELDLEAKRVSRDLFLLCIRIILFPFLIALGLRIIFGNILRLVLILYVGLACSLSITLHGKLSAHLDGVWKRKRDELSLRESGGTQQTA